MPCRRIMYDSASDCGIEDDLRRQSRRCTRKPGGSTGPASREESRRRASFYQFRTERTERKCSILGDDRPAYRCIRGCCLTTSRTAAGVQTFLEAHDDGGCLRDSHSAKFGSVDMQTFPFWRSRYRSFAIFGAAGDRTIVANLKFTDSSLAIVLCGLLRLDWFASGGTFEKRRIERAHPGTTTQEKRIRLFIGYAVW